MDFQLWKPVEKAGGKETRPELDEMVRDIERFLDNASLERGRTLCSFA
jgi:hypothetical protein